MRRVRLIVALGLAAAVVAAGGWWWMSRPRGSDPEAVRLLRAAAAQEAVTLSGEARVMGAGPDAPRRLQVMQQGDKMRLADGGAVVVDDGRDVYRLDPKTRTAQRYRAADVHGDLERLAENYVVTVEGGEQVAGRETAVVALRERGGAVAQRLWVDREKDVVLRQERYDQRGRVQQGMAFERVEYGTTAPQGAFEVPEGWEVVEGVAEAGGGPATLAALSKQVGFEVRAPGHVPQGFAQVGAGVVRMGRHGVPAAELRYSDGLKHFSVYEHAASGQRGMGRGRHGYRYRRGQAQAMGFRGSDAVRVEGSDIVVVAVGDLATDELARIAESVR